MVYNITKPLIRWSMDQQTPLFSTDNGHYSQLCWCGHPRTSHCSWMSCKQDRDESSSIVIHAQPNLHHHPASISWYQSWAHRSYKLSERSKAMSDLWFSEWKKMSVERWANCQKKEFAHRSKRSLYLKERAFFTSSLSERCNHVKFWRAVKSKKWD